MGKLRKRQSMLGKPVKSLQKKQKKLQTVKTVKIQWTLLIGL